MSYQPDPYASQDVYAQQQQLAKADAYAQPGAYPLPAKPVYPQPRVYPRAQPSYPPFAQPPVAPQPGLKVRNPWASSAFYSGIISLILGAITLFSLVGFAGLITGTLAIIRGIQALNLSKNLPNQSGRGMAITAIVLGVLGWIFVLLSFALRSF